MRVDPELVRQVATLARLDVPEHRVSALAAELSAILDYADQLAAIPESHGAAHEPPPLRLRADEPASPPGQALVAMAAEQRGGEVRVPTVVGEAP